MEADVGVGDCDCDVEAAGDKLVAGLDRGDSAPVTDEVEPPEVRITRRVTTRTLREPLGVLEP